MERLTFEGNFCDIAICQEVRGGSYCEDGFCSQRKTWERLKMFEDIFGANYNLDEIQKIMAANQDGRLSIHPVKKGDAVFSFSAGYLEGYLRQEVVTVVCDGYFITDYPLSEDDVLRSCGMHRWEDIGKMWFLSPDDAEKARGARYED